MYTRSMKSINDMTKHTTTSNFNSGTINGALVCCQINPICPAMSSRVPWNVSGSMVVVESLSILAYFFVSDEVMGNESLQYMWIYMRVSVYAWVIKGCVCVCQWVCSFAKRTRMFYYFIWASKLLLYFGWTAVIFASELRQGNVGKRWILSGLDHIISTQEADPLAL